MRTVVVDASAIINGFPMLILDTHYITAPSVIDEVKSRRGKKNLQTSIDFNIIDQRIPSFQAVLDVRKMAAETKIFMRPMRSAHYCNANDVDQADDIHESIRGMCAESD